MQKYDRKERVLARSIAALAEERNTSINDVCVDMELTGNETDRINEIITYLERETSVEALVMRAKKDCESLLDHPDLDGYDTDKVESIKDVLDKVHREFLIPVYASDVVNMYKKNYGINVSYNAYKGAFIWGESAVAAMKLRPDRVVVMTYTELTPEETALIGRFFSRPEVLKLAGLDGVL